MRRFTLVSAIVAIAMAIVAPSASADKLTTDSAGNNTYTGGTLNGSLVSGTEAKFSAGSGLFTIRCDTSNVSGSISENPGNTGTGFSTTDDTEGSTTSISYSDTRTSSGRCIVDNVLGATRATSSVNTSLDRTRGDADPATKQLILAKNGANVEGTVNFYTDDADTTVNYTCVYSASSLTGDMTNPSGGNHARAAFNDAMSKISGPLTCPSSSTYTATYDQTGAGGVDLWLLN